MIGKAALGAAVLATAITTGEAAVLAVAMSDAAKGASASARWIETSMVSASLGIAEAHASSPDDR